MRGTHRPKRRYTAAGRSIATPSREDDKKPQQEAPQRVPKSYAARWHRRSPPGSCAPPPRGTRVRTPFVYPDGGVVDVFVLAQDGEVCVTDLGEARWAGWTRSDSEGRPHGEGHTRQRRL